MKLPFVLPFPHHVWVYKAILKPAYTQMAPYKMVKPPANLRFYMRGLKFDVRRCTGSVDGTRDHSYLIHDHAISHSSHFSLPILTPIAPIHAAEPTLGG